MNPEFIVDPCVYCGESTSFGTGRFVNRITVDDEDGNLGWGCEECSGYECERCDKQIALDYEVTPEECFGENSVDLFSDGARHVCEDCLTKEEFNAREKLLEEEDNGIFS
tara:strand:- start:244 stop:573 length:330 start_codon:yes stop_codon:yes gene_type:complete